jgi:hypothetical protein
MSVVLLTEPFSGGGGGSGTVTSVDVSGGTTGLTTSGGPVTTAGVITLAGILGTANGGTGTAAPALVAGTNVTITGTWPNQTINSSGGGGSGTVTTVSVVSANGLAGSVANATTTPAITLSTTVTGLLKGNGTAISAATANTDYQSPITLTTTGSSGAATFIGNTLNIPQYSGGGSSGPILESYQTISQNYTLTSGSNGFSVGPVSITTGFAVTVPANARWLIAA